MHEQTSCEREPHLLVHRGKLSLQDVILATSPGRHEPPSVHQHGQVFQAYFPNSSSTFQEERFVLHVAQV